MDDSRVYGIAAGIIFALGMAVGMIWMSEYHGETIEISSTAYLNVKSLRKIRANSLNALMAAKKPQNIPS